VKRALAVLSSAAVLAAACKGSDGPVTLGDRPVLRSPIGGARIDTDTPPFVIQNARGFDQGEATYTFRVATKATDTEVATHSVLAGKGTTAITFPGPLLRGANLTWKVTATTPAGAQVTSDSADFRLPDTACVKTTDAYAKTVVDWWVPVCSLDLNHYDDPLECLGAPDAGGRGPDAFFGFIALGTGGFVSVDMEACAMDLPGDDVRVYQSVSSEPVTLYAGSSAKGPWTLVEYRKECGERDFPRQTFSNYCGFDLAKAGIEEARYFRVEDGENYPCPGDTVTEGSDIDAIQILHLKP
jgi:hypothetical protein